MSRGTNLTRAVKEIIASVWHEHPDWSAPKIRQEVQKQVHIVWPYDDPEWPRVSVVQKYVRSLKANYDRMPDESRGLESSWSIGASMEYGISCEAIPILVELRDYMKNMAINNIPLPQRLTVRQARWASLLFRITQNVAKLMRMSQAYAEKELLSKLMDVELDTSEIDDQVFKEPWIVIERNFTERRVAWAESLFGLRSTLHAFTTQVLRNYAFWLEFTFAQKRWPQLPKEQQIAVVMGLRDWVRETDWEPGRCPYEIVGKLDSELSREMKEEYQKLF